MITLKQNYLTCELSKIIFNDLVNYESGLIDRKDLLKQMLFHLYDNKSINTTEFDLLYSRVDKLKISDIK